MKIVPGRILASFFPAAALTLAVYQILPETPLSGKVSGLLVIVFLAAWALCYGIHTLLRGRIKYSKKTRIWLVMLAWITALMLVFTFHLSFPQKELALPKRSITIQPVAVESTAEPTAGSRAKLRFLSLNNGYRGIPISQFSAGNGWEMGEGQLVWTPAQTPEPIRFSGKAGKTVSLYFRAENLSGSVKIDWGDGQQETVALIETEPSGNPQQISHDYGEAACRREGLNFLLNLCSIIILLWFALFVYFTAIWKWLRVRSRTFSRAFLILSFATLLIRLINVYNFPVGWDEGIYSRAAMRYADSILSLNLKGIPETDYNLEHPALVKLVFAAPIVVDGRAAFDRFQLAESNRAALGREDYTIFTGRLVSAGFSLLTVQLLTGLIHPLAGFFFMIHSLAEEYGAQARLEAIPMLFSFLSVWFFCCFLSAWGRREKRRARGQLALSELFLGLTAASKIIYCVVLFAMIALLIETLIREKRSFAEAVGWMAGMALLSLAVFYVFNPSVWLHPLERIGAMFGFHQAYQENARTIYPWWQPIAWVTRSVVHQSAQFHMKNPLARVPETFIFSADELIFLLACLGVGRLFKKNRVYVYWILFGMLFLFLWGTKWEQYACVVTVPLCISASYGLRRVAGWLRADRA